MKEDERMEPNLDTTNSSHLSKPWLSKPGCWTIPRVVPGGESNLWPKFFADDAPRIDGKRWVRNGIWKEKKKI